MEKTMLYILWYHEAYPSKSGRSIIHNKCLEEIAFSRAIIERLRMEGETEIVEMGDYSTTRRWFTIEEHQTIDSPLI